ncbi:sensor histidine kinase [Alicyclobacillus acidocaldarius]|uniref:histidine kinase n=1 Tax=Alicyclobacillus acidocaldarius subsp. acidocaldarius (strain ATCC 27009 / DSM 446 / BCRC 14685 / JCM 5260 / KCTC 1825 / NBRC 15652 / NCIMB 11725 / NRRL B-14509 / 104-IA) TaxID=521098 RepID=C8WY19_ALIAD|nr:HAMP domain-containing sensor histidine kinase [Alicyclobacillus acidocaldarius]ACV58981.1 histidine kinase [Alicyclobacillus acidocaldarius subsp. acidocaldarius DSM 446]
MFRKTALRLVLLYTVVFAGILLLFSAVVYAFTDHRVRADEIATMSTAAANLRACRDEQILPGDRDDGEASPLHRGHSSGPGPDGDRLLAEVDETREQHLVYVLLSGTRVVLQTPAGSLTASEASIVARDGLGARPRGVSVAGVPYLGMKVELPRPVRIGDASANAAVILYNRAQDVAFLRELLTILSVSAGFFAVASAGVGFALASRALRPIRRSFEEQRRFVAHASHELRTPLAVMRLQIDRMFRHPGETILDMSEVIASLARETSRLQRLVNDLLTLAKADEGEAVLRLRPVDLATIAREAALRFAPLAEEKGVQLRVSAAETPIVADPDRLLELLSILVDNAIAFTPAGGWVEIDAHASGSAAVLAVRDTGRGIPPEHLPRVFDRFYQADPSRTTRGAGLGLSIAKWIAEAHGGQIRIFSPGSHGTGTEVEVRLPQSRSAEPGRGRFARLLAICYKKNSS